MFMSRNDVLAMFASFKIAWPSTWKALTGGELEAQAELWQEDLADLAPELVKSAVRAYRTTDTTGFAPSIGQIRAKAREIVPPASHMHTETEAVEIFKRAVRCGFSFPEEAKKAYSELPEAIQRAVGSPYVLWESNNWTQAEETRFYASFSRAYKAIAADADIVAALPPDVRELAVAARLRLRPPVTERPAVGPSPMELYAMNHGSESGN